LTPPHNRRIPLLAHARIGAMGGGFEGALSSALSRAGTFCLFAPRARTAMPKRLKRYYGQGHLHFITCSCYHRLPLLRSTHAKNLFTKTLGEVRERFGFALVGYVVMPEHIHLLIGEPKHATPSSVMQVLKQRVSYRLRHKRRAHAAQLRLRFDRLDDSLPRFWQLRFHDFNIWSHKKRVEKLQYMHLNPVKRGLVTHPKHWPWSSFSFYASRKSGLVPIDPVQSIRPT